MQQPEPRGGRVGGGNCHWLQGRCEELPPRAFGLTEPVPSGACAILVKEDFMDAPLTTCLLLDSLYVAVKQPGTRQSSVLLMHVCPDHHDPAKAGRSLSF